MTTVLVKKIPKEIQPLTFETLVTKIRQTLAEGRARAVEAVDRERARTYWETGRWIHIYLLKGKDRAKYGEKLFPRLEEILGLSESLLRDMHVCYREFPIPQTSGELAWSHYQVLLRIKDPKTRMFLTKEAAQKHWTARELAAAVRKIQTRGLPPPTPVPAPGGEGKKGPAGNLTPKKGKFFVYQIGRPQNMHEGAGGLSLDLGFRIRHEIEFKGIRNPKPGERVRAVRTHEDPAGGDQYKFVRDQTLKRSDLYTFKAKAQTFYDADTFWVDVDLGFRDWGEQKLRLRGIDAKELGQAGGEKAAAYVKKVLSGVSFIVISISGRDKFGRPLADVFYLPGADDREKVLRDGKFLNQELLDLGLAVRVYE